jgi:hypothetical protein
MSREIFVHIALGKENIFVGRLWFHSKKGKESASFEYDRNWLAHPEKFALEPALKLIEGVFHTGDDHGIFGAIGDSAPDRWGRVLMRRSEGRRAKSEKKTARTLTESDYLLGVNDELRQGALRFSEKDDEFAVEKWEAVALTLAKNSGIKIPEFSLIKIGKKPVLIVKRFDRIKKTRVPFLSAMSMLQARDNEQHSYLEIADALAQNGAAPKEDMKQLWRRIVFNVLISNTDDHLRNHGFLYESQKGWRLSPAYDLNPTPIEIKPRILTTAIDLNDTTASLETALSVAKDFRLEKSEANKIIKEVAKAVSKWREVSKNFDITKKEIERMASAFEHEDLEMANKISQ